MLLRWYSFRLERVLMKEFLSNVMSLVTPVRLFSHTRIKRC